MAESKILKELAEALFPDISKTPDDYEALYPPRQKADGARITRIAPSPTGYLHLGVLFTALVNFLTARQSGGVFYFRLEDTDKKREVEGGADDILAGLAQYGVTVDEGIVRPGEEIGVYGPYQQSRRVDIYQAYVKQLVCQGLAYPCFCSAQALSDQRQRQEQQKQRTGYYGAYAPCRSLTPEEAIENVRAGMPYVVRLRSPGSEERRVAFTDLIKGKIELPENDQDIVLLKTDGVPTYHFAHVVDDHLMRTTHVIRGDEWIASTPIHLQLFSLLGFTPPRYAHVSPIMKEDAGGKRKLSKRKDPEAAVHFYAQQGYPAAGLIEYLLSIANSDFEDWRRRNAGPLETFPFALKKMSVSGALFDLQKLNDVCKNVIARMDAATVTGYILDWAANYDQTFYALLNADRAYAQAIFGIDRDDTPKPRKDLAKWNEARAYAAYFYDELFLPASSEDWAAAGHRDDQIAILRAFAASYDPALDKNAWFDSVKGLCPALGYCPEVKAYKQDPAGFKGHVGDVTTVLRLAVTGRRNTPDLHRILQLLGKERVIRRIRQAIDSLSAE